LARGRVRGFSPEHLRKLREARTLTQQELATAAQVSVSSVQNWEAGTHCPDLTAANKLAVALSIAIRELIELPPDNVRLVDLRTCTGRYRAEVARELGWTLPVLGSIERGERAPNAHQRDELANLYEVEPAIVDAAHERTVAHREAVIAAKITSSG
jgi:transcriptional regulator with XRE-family HTH domain